MSFSRFVYHIVFSTKNRFPSINTENERSLYQILHNIMLAQGAHVFRIGGMPDHVHILTDIPATISPSQFIKKLKQESSYILSQSHDFPSWNGWENGYAAFSYSVSEIETIKHYIANQKEHHKKVLFRDEYRAWLIENGISPDAPYFPK